MPRTSRTSKIIHYAIVALVVIMLSLLAWWYIFLSAKEDTLRSTDLARGAGLAPPSFGEAVGSTYNNITKNLSSFIERVGTEGPESSSPRLRQVTKTPVAGAGFIVREPRGNTSVARAVSTSTSILRFVERGTGYVFESEANRTSLVRVTNTLVPQVYEALLAKNGAIIMRNIDETGAIVTFSAFATTTPSLNTASSSLSLSPLPKNIRTITFSPSGEEVLYILEEAGGSASLIRAPRQAGTGTRMARLGFSGWQIEWLVGNRFILTQHATDGLPGYAYEVGGNGSLVPLLSGIPDLALSMQANLSQAAKASGMLYSSGFTLSARANANASVVTLPIRTTAEKCVWALNNTLIAYCAVPQASPSVNAMGRWLRGEIHTADTWWKVDAGSGRAEILYTAEGGSRLDVERPVIDPKGEYIAFLNAVDKSLWLLRLSDLPAKTSAQAGE